MSDTSVPIGSGAGLCAACSHHRLIVSQKGSRFVLCERSKTEPAYARYPRLPMLRCEGFEPANDPGPSA